MSHHFLTGSSDELLKTNKIIISSFHVYKASFLSAQTQIYERIGAFLCLRTIPLVDGEWQ